MARVTPPPLLLAIDPGSDTGWALFDKGVLVGCGHMPFDKAISYPFSPFVIDLLFIEVPQAYPGAKQPVPVNDIIELGFRAGTIVGGQVALRRIVAYETTLPQAWKGGTPKEVHHRRLLSVLSATELGTVPTKRAKGAKRAGSPNPADFNHNILDAVALGLFRAGRVGRGGKRHHELEGLDRAASPEEKAEPGGGDP